MSGAVSAGWVIGGIAAVAGAATAANMYQANKQAKAQSSAARLAQEQAESEKQLQKQAQRRQEGGLNANISDILKQQQSASNSGGATLLTGAGGAGTSGTLGAGGSLA